jgi:hypothetical protein
MKADNAVRLHKWLLANRHYNGTNEALREIAEDELRFKVPMSALRDLMADLGMLFVRVRSSVIQDVLESASAIWPLIPEGPGRDRLESSLKALRAQGQGGSGPQAEPHNSQIHTDPAHEQQEDAA